MRNAILAVVAASYFAAEPALAQPKKDAPDCSDHPSFPRLQGYWIEGCRLNSKNGYNFDAGRTHNNVEGKYWYLRYQPQPGLATKASTEELLRAATTPIKSAGAEVIFAEPGKETLRLARDGKETWAEAWADHTGKYILTIVERPAKEGGPQATPTAQSPTSTPVSSKTIATPALSLVGTHAWSVQISTAPLALQGTQSWSSVITTGPLTFVGNEQ